MWTVVAILIIISISSSYYTRTAVQHKIKIPTDSFLETELRAFFIEYAKTADVENQITLIATENKHEANDIIEWCLKTNQYEYLITNNCEDRYVSLVPGSSHLLISSSLYIFLEAKELEDLLKKMEKCPFWYSKSNMFFIILTQVRGIQFLPQFLSTIWSNKILNFVVVFVDTKFNVVSYNEYEDQSILNFTGNMEDVFPNKLLDINGHNLRVGMFLDIPRNTKNALGVWYGPDYSLLKTISSMMNATLKIVESPTELHFNGLYDNVMNETVDFSFIPYYQIDILDGVEFSYPRQLENLVVLVPKAEQIPQDEYLFLIFDHRIWIILLVLLVLVACFLMNSHKIATKKDRSFTHWFLQSLKSFLSTGGVTGFDKKEFSGKFLLTIWMLFSIIIGAAFQCSFTSTLAKPKYFKEIDTLADLRKSELKIYCVDYFQDYILKTENYGLQDQLIFVGMDKMNEIRQGRTVKISFIDVFSRAVILAKHYDYHLVKEPIATGYTVYFFESNSVFTDEVHRCTLISREMGLSQKFDENMVIPRDRETTTTTTTTQLTFKHLESVFFLLLFGCQLSFIIFLFELLKRK